MHYTHICVLDNILKHIHTHTHTQHTLTYTDTHTCTHAHIHTYIHTHAHIETTTCEIRFWNNLDENHSWVYAKKVLEELNGNEAIYSDHFVP